MRRLQERPAKEQYRTTTTTVDGVPFRIQAATHTERPDAKHQRRRRAAAQAISPLLKRDPEWREETLKALLLHDSSAEAKKGQPAVLLAKSYQHFYRDSFFEQVQREPPAELHRALHLLVKAGFNCPRFAQQYCRRKAELEDTQLLFGKATGVLLEAERELEARQVKYNRAARDLEQLQERYSKLAAAEEEEAFTSGEETPRESSSLWGGAVQTVSSWLFPSLLVQPEERTGKTGDSSSSSRKIEIAKLKFTRSSVS
jgi:hypothetical protein